MAEALVSVLLQRLTAISLDKVGEEFKLVTGVDKEVASLTSNLEAIQAVLKDAEQRQVAEATVRRWLSELTQVSLEMDDLLDEWITEVLIRQMDKVEKQALTLTIAEKVLSSASSFISGLSHRRKIAGRIRELNGKIDLIAKQKQDFSFQNFIARVPQLPQRPKTTSLPNVKTFGRDIEKNLIISKLLGESSERNEFPLIIPIVGMGGMGKTFLANLVYNDEKIKSHFDKSIWVCVSDPFEEIKIAQAIIEGLDKDDTSKNSDNLQTLVQCIHKLLEGKKFLLVLDDVWSPNPTQWEELIKPLRNGIMGSRVLVTTRKEEVVVLMKSTTQMIRMNELGESFCLSLFYYNAGIDESSVSEEFSEIGLELVRRCKGLPLAAKSLGSLMQNKKTIHEWRTILNSKIWELKEIEHEVFQPLLLSYHDLNPSVKQCLLYCVLFPKDYTYEKTRLIENWMAQDYLNVKGSEEVEITGQNYFDDLVKRSFFQDIKVHYVNGNITCKIHDIVYDFLQYLSENEYFVLDSGERKQVPNDKVCHIAVVEQKGSGAWGTQIDFLVSFLFKCKRLRTLTFFLNLENTPMFESIVQLKGLRTLNMSCNRSDSPVLKIPETVGGLIHLRYLDLSGNKLRELPRAMSRLYNLQTLRLVGCQDLKKVDVRRLINLRHLFVRHSYRLRVIKGIEKLTNLQTLDTFSVFQNVGDEGNTLEDLKDLNQLHGNLTVYIGGNRIMVENAAYLVKKIHLQEVNFFYCGERPVEYMDGLEPHPGLEILTILGYGGTFSNWLSSLHCLRDLTLMGCKCGFLPPLGKLASLESLQMLNLNSVSKVGVEFLGIIERHTSSSSNFTSFPKLRELYIQNMESWEEWEEENSANITIMPCLSRFTIEWCEKLKALPDYLLKTPLQQLHIIGSPILQDLYRQENDQEWAKISHISRIKI